MRVKDFCTPFCTPFQNNIDIAEDLCQDFFPNARLLPRLLIGMLNSTEQFSGLIRPFLCNPCQTGNQHSWKHWNGRINILPFI